jgi:hypothetical protein
VASAVWVSFWVSPTRNCPQCEPPVRQAFPIQLFPVLQFWFRRIFRFLIFCRAPPPLRPEALRVEQPLLRQRRARVWARTTVPGFLPRWPVPGLNRRAKWFCGCGWTWRRWFWPAARSNHGQWVRAPAAYPRPARCARLLPATFWPAFPVRAPGVPTRFRQRIWVPVRCRWCWWAPFPETRGSSHRDGNW